MPKNLVDEIKKYRKAIGENRFIKPPIKSASEINNIFPNVNYYNPSPFIPSHTNYIAVLALSNIIQGKNIGTNLALFTICLAALSPSLLQLTSAEEMNNFNSNITFHHLNDDVLSNDHEEVFEQTTFSSLPTEQTKPLTDVTSPTSEKTFKQEEKKSIIENRYQFHYQPQKITVEPAPDFKDYIKRKLTDNNTRQEGEALKKELTKLTALIKEQIAKLPLHPELLNRLQTSGLSIFIDHPTNLAINLGTPRRYGYAIPSTKRIIFRFEEGYTEKQVRNILLNEFHHMAVADTNRRTLEPNIAEVIKNRLAKPFLNKDGTLNKDQFNQLKIAAKEFVENIEKLKDPKLKNKNPVSKLRQAIIEYYDPVIYVRPASENHIMRYKSGNFKTGEMLYLPELKESFKVVGILPHDIYGIPLDQPGNKGILVKHIINVPDTDEGKIAAFIYDMTLTTQIFGLTTNKAPSGPRYASLDEERRLAELSSDIEKLPSEIKQLLCPKWCKYFSNFHGIEDYCNTQLEKAHISKMKF